MNKSVSFHYAGLIFHVLCLSLLNVMFNAQITKRHAQKITF